MPFDIRSTFATILSYLTLIPIPSLGINVLDIVIVGVIIFYAYEGCVLGLLLASVDLLSFVLSFLIALKGYAILGGYISTIFNIPHGFANAIGFFLIALVSEIILNLAFRKLIHYIPPFPRNSKVYPVLKKMDHYLGFLPGIISAGIIISFLLTVVISLPSSPFLKQAVTESRIGSRLVTQAASVEKTFNDIFGGALYDTLNFLTVEPKSDETLALRFTVASPIEDPTSEQEMLSIVNKERKAAGAGPLVMDGPLRSLARDYATDMFQKGYFSHTGADGTTPFDRMDNAGIQYLSAGENLALAPSTELAMQGLMNSPGHRENILSPNFNRVGIGVMDGGIYGKMFVQEFSN